MTNILIIVDNHKDVKRVVGSMKELMFNVRRAVISPVGTIETDCETILVVSKNALTCAVKGYYIDFVINLATFSKEELTEVRRNLVPILSHSFVHRKKKKKND